MINREIYLAKLRQLRDQNLIKVVTGIRRSGKSTLLEAFKNELATSGVARKNIIFYNFEERESLHLIKWATLYDEIIKKITNEKKYYVFLDEVQLVNDFEKLVNALFTKKNIDLYVTGSNAYLLSSELATLLTGRYIAINIQTYSFAEYALAYYKEKYKMPEEAYPNALKAFRNGLAIPLGIHLGEGDQERIADIIIKVMQDGIS